MQKIYIFVFLVFNFFSKAGTPSIIFKENKGQWPNKVLFGSEFSNTKFYINQNSFNYCVYNYYDLIKAHEHHLEPEKANTIHGHNYEVNFVGANFTKFIKKDALSEYYNYFLGNDKNKWASNVKAFEKIKLDEIYKGVDLSIYSNNTNLKYDFIVAPNTNPNVIILDYKYVDGVEIKNNELIIKTSVGDIIEKAPLAYQIINNKKEIVKCDYVLVRKNTIGFSFPEKYNNNYELIIDPVVVVCSYSGNSMGSNNYACTFDDKGNIYNTGGGDMGYPTTLGAFQSVYQSDYDIVLSVYNSSGSSKLFSTYLGGDSIDVAVCAVVANNEISILVNTSSKNFPHTLTAFDTIANGDYDLVVSKINLAGTSLLASTYIGGGGKEGFNQLLYSIEYPYCGEMVCDTSGNVYVLSATSSTNFPVSSGAYSTTKKGAYDACIFKLDKLLSNLVWSTYLGGTAFENGKSIKLDGSGGVYCFGTTNSTNFPTTTGSFSSTKSGTTDFFISHINSTGTTLIASTFLGTTSSDYGALMDLDQSNNVYVCGAINNSSLLIPTSGIYYNTNGYNTIYKMNSSLSNVLYKTKYGNNISGVPNNLYITAFKVDSCQNVYISGWGANSFPTTPNAFQPYGGGATDLYFAVFNPNCSSLSFASFFGGSTTSFGEGEHSDGGISHFDSKGCLYQAICSQGGLPTTTNAYDPIFVNTTTMTTIWNDAFVKVDFQTYINATSSYGANLIGCQPFTANFVSATNTGTLSWNFGDGSPISYQNNETHTYSNLGNYNVVLVVSDTSTCNKIDSIKTNLSVVPQISFDFGADRFICINNTIQLASPVNALTYLWNTGATTPTITITQPGNYILVADNGGGCSSYDNVNFVIGEDALSSVFPNIVTPNGDGVNDFIDLSKYNFNELQFSVYDRWGKQMYQSSSASDHWNPSNYSDGTYFYVVSYRSDCTGEYKNNKGYISIFK